MIQRVKAAAVALFLAAWLLSHAWKGLLIYFTGDDMMNLYQAWALPAWKIFAANLSPFSTVYRPFGTAVYRVVFALAGWRPLEFRVVVYAFLLLNIWLVYRVARRLTGSAEIGVLAALLFSYHRNLMDLYLNNGTLYDVLACAFFLLALEFFLQSRWVWFLVSYVVALNSKEMAAALPLVLLAYVMIYRRRPHWALWASIAITGAAFVAKTSAPAFAGIPDYHLHLTLRQFFTTTRPLLGELFYLANPPNAAWTMLLFAAVWGVAAATRSKPLLLAAAFLTLTPLPANFITYRGFFVMYLPLAGWAMYFAIALVEGRNWLWKKLWKRPPLAPGSWEPERIGLFVLTAYVLFAVQAANPHRSFDEIDPSKANIRTLKLALEEHPQLRPGARILLLHDPFPREYYDPLFIARLNYGDVTLSVDRDRPQGEQPYDLVLDYDGGRYH